MLYNLVFSDLLDRVVADASNRADSSKTPYRLSPHERQCVFDFPREPIEGRHGRGFCEQNAPPGTPGARFLKEPSQSLLRSIRTSSRGSRHAGINQGLDRQVDIGGQVTVRDCSRRSDGGTDDRSERVRRCATDPPIGIGECDGPRYDASLPSTISALVIGVASRNSRVPRSHSVGIGQGFWWIAASVSTACRVGVSQVRLNQLDPGSQWS